jgi:hypothetical protein
MTVEQSDTLNIATRVKQANRSVVRSDCQRARLQRICRETRQQACVRVASETTQSQIISCYLERLRVLFSYQTSKHRSTQSKAIRR